MDDQLPKLYPAWRQAEVDLIAAGLAYGSLITDEWLDAAFGIKPPQTIAEAERAQLVRLSQRESLRESLLENHSMLLSRVTGVGYSVVPPELQTKVAVEQRTKEIRAALHKLAREISFVNTALLSDEQRKENSDAQAKLGGLRSLFRKQLKG
jgi:hypothetical protein